MENIELSLTSKPLTIMRPKNLHLPNSHVSDDAILETKCIIMCYRK